MGSLVEDLKAAYESDGLMGLHDLDAECLEEGVVHTSRWHNWTEFIYKRNDEYAAALIGIRATEYQENSDSPEFYTVEPRKVTKIRYVRTSDSR